MASSLALALVEVILAWRVQAAVSSCEGKVESFGAKKQKKGEDFEIPGCY